MPRPSGMARRQHRGPVRNRGLTVKFSEAEHAEVQAAAQRAGMAVSAWIGMTATGAARHELIALTQFHQDVIRELVRCRSLTGQAGSLLNQSVAKLNSTGVANARLERAVAWAVRVMHRVDDVVELVRDQM